MPNHVIGKILLRCQIRSNHVFNCWTHHQPVRGLVIGTEAEALPHRNRFRILHALPVIFPIATVRYIFDRIRKSTHEIPIIMRVASAELECAVRTDCPDRARGQAQLVSWTARTDLEGAAFREAKDCVTSSPVVIRLFAPSESTVVMSVFTVGGMRSMTSTPVPSNWNRTELKLSL